MFSTIRKKIAVDTFVYPWNVGLTCGNCAQQFTVTRRKKLCMFCKASFCTLCIERRPDKRLSCRKCIVLTARPLDRAKLFDLKSRDLQDYLSSRHISTTDCIEKEDLVNAVLHSVNVPQNVRRSSSGSYPSTPRRSSLVLGPSCSRSSDDLRSMDGIRVNGMDTDTSSSATSPIEPEFVVVDHLDCEPGNRQEPAEEVPEVPEVPPEPPRRFITLSEIHTEENLETLTIRQLKELLALNRIDFSGCVEKTELMAKVKRLWADYVETRKDIANMSSSELCKICMDAPMECVLLECGHIATCIQCGKQLSECPICRQFVVRCVRTFKA